METMNQELLNQQEEIQKVLEDQRVAMLSQREAMINQQAVQAETALENRGTVAVDLGAAAIFLARRDDLIITNLSLADAASYRAAGANLNSPIAQERAVDLLFVKEEERTQQDKDFIKERIAMSEAMSSADSWKAYVMNDQLRIQQELTQDDDDEDDDTLAAKVTPISGRKSKKQHLHPSYSGDKAA